MDGASSLAAIRAREGPAGRRRAALRSMVSAANSLNSASESLRGSDGLKSVSGLACADSGADAASSGLGFPGALAFFPSIAASFLSAGAGSGLRCNSESRSGRTTFDVSVWPVGNGGGGGNVAFRASGSLSLVDASGKGGGVAGFSIFTSAGAGGWAEVGSFSSSILTAAALVVRPATFAEAGSGGGPDGLEEVPSGTSCRCCDVDGSTSDKSGVFSRFDFGS